MKNKNKWSGYYTGKDFEERIIKQLSAEGYEPVKDKTLSDGKRRQKDIKADILTNTGHKIELKSTTYNTNLTFAMNENGKNVNIKFHQIVAANYFIFEFRPNPAYVVSKITFLNWWCTLERKKMSIMWKDVEKIGFKLDTFDFLKEG
ncbi:hypothetical protein N9924_00890 [bacterium]|nr:hypothetical protein [bacterium]